MPSKLPDVFIGSSSEGIDVARAIEVHLQRSVDTTLWTNGVFRPGVSYLQSLLGALDTFDFAILVLTPDDVLEVRDSSYSSPRDNVLFELGLFMGHIGPRRTFFVAEESDNLKLPSDLSGISRLDYRRRENLIAAVSPVCTMLIEEIRKQGRRDNGSTIRAQLTEPASEPERTVRTLARNFFSSPIEVREKTAEEIRALASLVPLERVLLMSDSIVPSERVAAGIALAVHVRNDPTLATASQVREAIARGLDDARSRVRYRYVQLLREVPQLASDFREWLQFAASDDSNEAVRHEVIAILLTLR
jgi:hypothetical protein